MKFQRGRHTPAFILLYIAEKPSYGFELLHRCNEELLDNTIDVAAIYLSLKELEKDNCIISHWEQSTSGPPKKLYQITETGYEKLEEYKHDILERLENLQHFTNVYSKINA
ncbi:PadR family transcriptional regulator [Bacillus massiliigorillae]|uniref:PadR family transcriptional regulator n=1 Tax=Bacillus massiliigorillae TaxID=1243664 RepID=UPI0003AB171D|nr:PadR family transcriptional regulator [Bacillus massiliigorillae]